MASGDDRASTPDGLTGKGLRVAIVRSRWNSEIVDRLLDGARRGLADLEAELVDEVSVPGSFEIPFAAQAIACSGKVDSVICLGVVIRGETTHYEIVSEEAARGVQDMQLKTGIPMAFGLLTVENHDQALARSEGPSGHNVGEESALVAVEMARLSQQWCAPE